MLPGGPPVLPGGLPGGYRAQTSKISSFLNRKIQKENAEFMDSLDSFAKMELSKWTEDERKKKLCDIFPPADSEMWKNYDVLEAAAAADENDPDWVPTGSEDDGDE